MSNEMANESTEKTGETARRAGDVQCGLIERLFGGDGPSFLPLRTSSVRPIPEVICHESDDSDASTVLSDAASTLQDDAVGSRESKSENWEEASWSLSSTNDQLLGPARKQKTKKLGTLNGVYLPCLQTILGVILFLRLTNITSQAGCFYTTLIILTSVTSTFLTSLSLSAIATNGTICAGGPYYVISRTLGVEIGGALGLLYYLGATIAGSMYVLGAVEAAQRTLAALHSGGGMGFTGHLFPFDTQIFSLLCTSLLAVVVMVGIRYVNMTSKVFLGMVILSICCMCLGCLLFGFGIFYGQLNPWDRVFFDNMRPNYEPDPVTGITPSFFSLLAIFYPSVTGILAGSNRSAVLENPGKAIPKGTIGAIGTTTAIYVFVVWLFGMTMSNLTLKDDKFVVASVAFPHGAIVRIGVVMSCFGAALQSFASASRLLAAIALDDVIPFLRWFRPYDSHAEPKRAVWLTWFLASVPTLAGNLDHVTPLVTSLYLLMYSGINCSCFLLGALKSPGFRPTFKYFHWSMSLVGFVWCLGLAFVISRFMTLAAMLMFILLYIYNKKQETNKDWGDVGDAIRYNIVTALLQDLSGTTTEHLHAKNWRPQLLTFIDADDCGNPIHLHALSLASQLKKGRGINMVVSIIECRDQEELGCLDRPETVDFVQHSKALLQQHMAREGMDGFAEVIASTGRLCDSLWSAVVHTGLGPLSPNTVMLTYPTTWKEKGKPWRAEYLTTIRGITNMSKAVILFRGCYNYPSSTDLILNGTIDVWWVVHDGGLLLLLPYILSRNAVWGQRGARAKLRLFAVTTTPDENPEQLKEAVIEHLTRIRISASVTVVDLSDTTIADDMREAECVMSRTPFCPGGHQDSVLQTPPSAGTNHMTVGEVFSSFQTSHEVPYPAVQEDTHDIEIGVGAAHEPPSAMEVFPGMSLEDDLPEGLEAIVNDADIAKRLKTARSFNSELQHHSKEANLVVVNMPLIRANRAPEEFYSYVDVLCDGMDNVLLVRGSGAEVITTYA